MRRGTIRQRVGGPGDEGKPKLQYTVIEDVLLRIQGRAPTEFDRNRLEPSRV